jgi:hypothetical protein
LISECALEWHIRHKAIFGGHADILCAQPDPIIAYTWDINVTTDTAKGPRLELTANSISGLTSARQCKERSCVAVEEGGYFTVPRHNYGQYAGLTFSVWFKSSGSGPNAKIFDFGNGATDQNGHRIYMGRAAATQGIKFVIARGEEETSALIDEGVWVESVWRHVVWSLMPTTLPSARWSVYIDGILKTTQQGFYPVNADLTTNYIAKSIVATDGTYVGLLDSFLIFPGRLNSFDVATVMQVSRCGACFPLCDTCQALPFRDGKWSIPIFP